MKTTVFVLALVTLGLSGCKTTGSTAEQSPAPVAQAAKPAISQTRAFGGRYKDSGNPWSAEVNPDGTASFGDREKWPAIAVQVGRDIVLTLPEDYTWGGTRMRNSKVQITLNEEGECTGMTFTGVWPGSGQGAWDASCSG